MTHSPLQKGFTLIELLVVIAIISLLSAVVLASLNSARAKSRDARRLEDMVQIRTALEFYASDNNGHYPLNVCNSGGGVCGSAGEIPSSFIGTSPTCNNYDDTHVNRGLDALITGKYMSKIPGDPKPSATNCYMYYGIPDDTDTYGVGYKLRVFGTVETYDTQTSKHSLRDLSGDPFCGMVSLPANSVLRKSLAISAPQGLTPAAECL